MKKLLSVSVIAACLLATSAVGAFAAEKEGKGTGWSSLPEVQSLKALQVEKKALQDKRKAQTQTNKQAWDILWGDVTPEVRETVKSALAETKPLREENKTLSAELKEAKKAKDKEKVVSIKAEIAANHTAIEEKLAQIQTELTQVKEKKASFKEMNQQLKPIRTEKKENKEQAKELKAKEKSTVKEAKEVFKAGDKEQAATSLQEAADLLKDLTQVQSEILEQKQAISEIIQ
ncbi:hypothetical protein ABH14_11475 [Brevibacillus brevis]|uniref:hypothetical protein n=1 Tax=Brevibacillus brevis TaxID=1393 RepID=UPI00190036DF|nr:hypothetical protein [Brevibacillus brevis]MBH0330405.1 hypothetical protein [Brevibacillus brevis]